MSWEHDDEATHIFGGNDPAVDAPWQVNVSETETRTMTAVDIGLEYGRGTLDANETYVWREGMRDWAPLGQCPELVPVLSQFAAKRQQSMAPPVPGRAVTAPQAQAQAPGPLFAPTPSFVPPRPVASTPPGAMPFLAPPALSSGSSPLRGPMPSQPAIPQGVYGTVPGGPQFGYPPGAGGAAMPDFSAHALAAGQLPEKKASPLKMGLLVGGVVGVLGIGGGVAYMLTRAPAGGAAQGVEVSVPAPSGKPAGDAVPQKPSTDPVGDPATAEAAATATAEPVAAATAAAAVPEAARHESAAGTAPTAARGGSAAAVAPEPKKEEPKKESKGSSEGASFSVDAARSALSSAAGAASGCGRPGGPNGRGRATVTFASSGAVATASVDPPFAGTPVGSCALAAFRGARVPPFSGSAQSVTKSFNVK